MTTAIVKFYAYISGAWVQLNDVQPMSGQQGIMDNSPEARLADIGSMTLSLDNSTRIYTPGVTAGWKKGIPFKMVVTFDGEDRIKFKGAIEDIQLESSPSDKLVRITALDWFDYASKYPIVNPDLLTNVTTDTAISSIVSSMPIQPENMSLDNGNVVYPSVFDTVKNNTKAYAELAKLINSEIGYCYLKSNETLVFESSDNRNGTRTAVTVPKSAATSGWLQDEAGNDIFAEDGHTILQNESDAATYTNIMVGIDADYGKNIVNRFTTNAYPKKTDTVSVKLYETERDLYIAPAETKTFRVFWKDPTGKRSINAVPPSGNSTTKALVHFNSQDGVLFYDETGKVWTASEEETFVNNITRFGGGAAYLDATNSYLTTPHSADWEFGSGDFTVEWWEHRFAATSGQVFFSRDGTDAVPAWIFGRSNGTNLLIDISSDGASNDIANGKSLGAITTNTWNHFAVCRSGSNFYAYKNGVLTDSWISALSIFASSTPLYIGRNVATYLGACVDEVRITKGECLYPIAFTTPSAEFSLTGTLYSMWTGVKSSGTDITPYIVASADYGTEGATFTVQNTSTNSGYLTINTYGYGIYSDSQIEDTQEDWTSITTYGYQNEGLSQPYKQDLYEGILEGQKVIEENREPRLKLNKITLVANSSDFLMMSFLYVEVGDLVRIVNTWHGIDAVFYVQGIEFSMNGGIITYSWILKQAWTLEKGLTYKWNRIYLDYPVDASGQAVTFDYIPAVSGSNVVRRAFSAWIKFQFLKSTHDMAIISNYTGDSGFSFQVDQHATNRYLSFRIKFSGAVGKWTCPANAFSPDVWTHVLVYYDSSTPTNDPLIYIGGVLQSLTETSTPTGTVSSEVGSQLHIGNYKTSAGYVANFSGYLKDVRCYDMDKSVYSPSELAAGIVAEGVSESGYFSGIVFHASTFTENSGITNDIYLTESQKLLDSYGGNVGTPYGSPFIKIGFTDL